MMIITCGHLIVDQVENEEDMNVEEYNTFDLISFNW